MEVRPCDSPDVVARLVGNYLVATEREKGLAVASPADLTEPYRQSLSGLLAAGDDTVALVAWSGDQAAGCVLVKVTGVVAEVKRLWVEPEHRAQGVARALLAAAIETAREQGATRVTLTVWNWRDRAIALYEATGFERVESWDERSDVVCMTMDLAAA